MTRVQMAAKGDSEFLDVATNPGERCEEGLPRELAMHTVYLQLRTLNDGLLLPWTAPAIRGLILKPLRDRVCQEMGGRELQRVVGLSNWREQRPVSAERELEQRNQHYCTGCRKNASCSYGRVFEPDLNVIDRSLIQRGDAQGVRGISIASAMLVGEPAAEKPAACNSESIRSYQLWAPQGTELSLRLLALGNSSHWLPAVVQAVESGGRSAGIGYQAPVRFAVEKSQTVSDYRTISLDALTAEACGGRIPEVTLEFLSPLLIKNCTDRGRLVPPSFHDLFSNSVRIVIRAIREFANREFLLGVEFGDFFRAARSVESSHHQLIEFQQPSISHRHGPASSTASQSTASQMSSRRGRSSPSYGERPLRGWLGSITFSGVPSSYLPWLIHAGQLGIGTDRNRGAGLWRVVL